MRAKIAIAATAVLFLLSSVSLIAQGNGRGASKAPKPQASAAKPTQGPKAAAPVAAATPTPAPSKAAPPRTIIRLFITITPAGAHLLWPAI